MVVCALFAVGTAHAGDYKGFYVGVNGGAAAQNSKAKTTTVFSPTGYFALSSVPAIAAAGAQSPSTTGFTGGVQGGYNFQRGNLVLGIETDFGSMYTGASKTATATYPCCAPTNFTITQSVDTNYLYTLRPRVGFTAGRVLLFGTGGLAVTRLKYRELFTDTFATAHETGAATSNQLGWTGGGGAEFKINSNLSFKGEYLYADFGSVSATSTNLTAFPPTPIAFPTNVFSHSASLTAHIIRFGINAHF